MTSPATLSISSVRPMRRVRGKVGVDSVAQAGRSSAGTARPLAAASKSAASESDKFEGCQKAPGGFAIHHSSQAPFDVADRALGDAGTLRQLGLGQAEGGPPSPQPSRYTALLQHRSVDAIPRVRTRTRWATRWASRHGSFVDGLSEWARRINKVQWRCRDDVHGIQQEIGEALLRGGPERGRPRCSRPDRTPRLRRAQPVSRPAQRNRRPEGASRCHRGGVQTGLHRCTS